MPNSNQLYGIVREDRTILIACLSKKTEKLYRTYTLFPIIIRRITHWITTTCLMTLFFFIFILAYAYYMLSKKGNFVIHCIWMHDKLLAIDRLEIESPRDGAYIIIEICSITTATLRRAIGWINQALIHAINTRAVFSTDVSDRVAHFPVKGNKYFLLFVGNGILFRLFNMI